MNIVKIIERFLTHLREGMYGNNLKKVAIDFDNKTLELKFDFNGWYEGEKIIDNIYWSYRYRNVDYSFSTSSIQRNYKDIFNIEIIWENLVEEEEEVPEPMKDLLSGATYEQYKNF